MLEHLKVIYGHASRNVLKRCQNMIDGVPIFHSKTPILTSISLKPKGSKPNLFAFIDFRPFASDGEWMMTKVHCCIANLRTWQQHVIVAMFLG